MSLKNKIITGITIGVVGASAVTVDKIIDNEPAVEQALEIKLSEEIVQNLQTIKTHGEALGREPGKIMYVGDSITASWHWVGKIATEGLLANETGIDYGYGFNQLSSHQQVVGSFLDWINVYNYSTDGWGPPSCGVGGVPDGTWCYGMGECCGSVAGDTVRKHQERGYASLAVDNMNASWCTIMLGTNDIVDVGVRSFNAGYQQWGDEYKAYVQEYINLGVIPVVITIPPRYTAVPAYYSPNGIDEVRFDYVDSMNVQIKRVSRELAIPLIDLNAAIKAVQPNDPIRIDHPDGTFEYESGTPGSWFGNFIHGWNHPYGTGIHLDSANTRYFDAENLYGETSHAGYALVNNLIFDMGIAIKEQVFDVQTEPGPDLGPVTYDGLTLPSVEHIINVSTTSALIDAVRSVQDNTRIILAPGAYFTNTALGIDGKTNVQIINDPTDNGNALIIGDPMSNFDFYSENEAAVFFRVGPSKDIIFAWVYFVNSHAYGLKIDGESSPENITIWRCNFYNIGMRMIKGSGTDVGDTHANTGTIRYCHFENYVLPLETWRDNGNYIAAIDMMNLKDWVISDNTFKNVRGLTGEGRAAIFIWNRSENITTERNEVILCDRGIAYGNPYGNENHVTCGIIRNNVVLCGPDAGIELSHVSDIDVFHNTILRDDGVEGTRGIRCIAPVNNVYIVYNENTQNTEVCDGAYLVDGMTSGVLRTNEVLDNFDGGMRERITNIGAY